MIEMYIFKLPAPVRVIGVLVGYSTFLRG